MNIRRFLINALAVAAGLGGGYLFYRLFGCQGSCPLNSNPVVPMLAGLLLAVTFIIPDAQQKGD